MDELALDTGLRVQPARSSVLARTSRAQQDRIDGKLLEQMQLRDGMLHGGRTHKTVSVRALQVFCRRLDPELQGFGAA